MKGRVMILKKFQRPAIVTESVTSGKSNMRMTARLARVLIASRFLLFKATAAAALIGLTATGVLAQNSTIHADGAYAYLNGILPTLPITYFHLEVHRTLNGSSQGSYLLFNRFVTNSDCVVTETDGYGNIPFAAFTSSSDNHLTLNVDTGAVPGFINSVCTNDFCNSIFSCSNTAGGLFSIDWTNNHLFSQTQSGSTSYTTGNITVSTQGTSSSSTASVNGIFLGDSLSDATADGGMGDTHNAFITVTKSPHP